MELKISVKDGKTCEKILKIEVAGGDVQKEFEEFYREVAPHAKIPGFRPGKAPRGVLAMHFQNEAREKVLRHLIAESYRQTVREKSLEPIGVPEIEEVDFKDDRLSYQARIEIRPKIKLGRATGLSAKREKPVVKPEEIEEGLKRVQESLVQYKAVEDRPITMGDFVIADYVCSIEGKEVEKRENDWFEIREDEFLKGFSVQLVGAKPADEREVKITFPEKTGRKELAGKPAVFKVKVKEIKTKILPPLSDDLAREAGEFKTLADLRQQIEKDIFGSKERGAEAALEKALLDELVKQNKVDLPAGLVERRLEHLMHEAQEALRRRGAPEEEFEKTKETLRARLAEEAKRQVHLAFLLDEIALRENLTVAEDEIKERYRRIAGEIRQSAEAVESITRNTKTRVNPCATKFAMKKPSSSSKRTPKYSDELRVMSSERNPFMPANVKVFTRRSRLTAQY